MNSDTEMKGVISFSIIVGIICAFLTQRAIFSPEEFVEASIVIKVFLSSMNAVLLGGLTYNYLRIYRKMPTSTSRVFLIFSSTLFLYALTANPVIQLLFGYDFIPLGPFTYMPDLFVSIAAVSVLYESYK